MVRTSVPRGGQLPFDFPGEVLSFDDLVVTPSNATAVGILQKSASWPRVALCLLGGPRSGRTTLLRAWSTSVDAKVVEPSAFDQMKLSEVETLAERNVAIDNANALQDEELLLSLLNFAERSNVRVLLTSQAPPSQWTRASADLVSRLHAMPIAEIGPPDEAMLRARLSAAGRRHFLRLNKEVLDYLTLRLGRSYEELDAYIDRLSVAVTRLGRPPTVPLARDVLEEDTPTDDLFDGQGSTTRN